MSERREPGGTPDTSGGPFEALVDRSTSDEGAPSDQLSRRDFVRGLTLASAGAAAAIGAVLTAGGTVGEATKGTARELPVPKTVPASAEADPLIRMQRELAKAMAKPIEQRRWSMVIDTRKCVGCHACTVACIAENKLPPGVVYRPVVQQEIGTYPNVQLRFMPRPCMQCDEPPCVPVCPVEATWKRPDGITVVDYDKCIGCRYCLNACPYGARTSDFGLDYSDDTPERQPYENLPNHEYGKSWNRAHHGSPVGNARKCHFCLHRIEQGLLPQCVSTCIGRANYFGDANDPDSLVSEKAREPNQMRLLEHLGTKPKVIYLI